MCGASNNSLCFLVEILVVLVLRPRNGLRKRKTKTLLYQRINQFNPDYAIDSLFRFTNTKKTSFYADFLTENIIYYVEVKQIK